MRSSAPAARRLAWALLLSLGSAAGCDTAIGILPLPDADPAAIDGASADAPTGPPPPARDARPPDDPLADAGHAPEATPPPEDAARSLDGGVQPPEDAGERPEDAVPPPDAAPPPPPPHDPVVFVHGYLGRGDQWDPMIVGLVARGWAADRLFAFTIADTNDSIIEQASFHLAPYVVDVLVRTGAARVDLVGHGLGGLVARYYVARLGGNVVARTVISVDAPQHGNESACAIARVSESAHEQCPAYARGNESHNGMQQTLNGHPDRLDVDETPFGVEDGGSIRWRAIALRSNPLIVTPYDVGCLDQSFRGDCSSPVNVVLDWQDAEHVSLIRDPRLIDLVAGCASARPDAAPRATPWRRTPDPARAGSAPCAR